MKDIDVVCLPRAARKLSSYCILHLDALHDAPLDFVALCAFLPHLGPLASNARGGFFKFKGSIPRQLQSLLKFSISPIFPPQKTEFISLKALRMYAKLLCPSQLSLEGYA